VPGHKWLPLVQDIKSFQASCIPTIPRQLLPEFCLREPLPPVPPCLIPRERERERDAQVYEPKTLGFPEKGYSLRKDMIEGKHVHTISASMKPYLMEGVTTITRNHSFNMQLPMPYPP